jgi:hypothetical protein
MKILLLILVGMGPVLPARCAGWIESGSIFDALLIGDAERVRTYIHAVKQVKFPKTAGSLNFKAPFNIGDAGWLLQILASDAAGHKTETRP